MDYIKIIITEDMITAAQELCKRVRVNRTVTSRIDTLTGIIGEFIFAEWLHDDWKNNRVGENKGETDFENIEIKTSAFPFSENLNLLVREEYARSRKPRFYVQVIIDVDDHLATEIAPGTYAYICGWATSDEVDRAPKRDFGSKFGGEGGYTCHYISILELHPMHTFEEQYFRE